MAGHVLVAQARCFLEDDLSQVRQCVREVQQRGVGLHQVCGVDAEDLTVLERVENPLFSVECL